MKLPFHDDWVALRTALKRISGRSDGESIFGRLPFGRFTGGHFTGYPIWVLLIPAAILLTIQPSIDGWLFFGGPVVFGPAIAFLVLRRRGPRVIEQTVPAASPQELPLPALPRVRLQRPRSGFGSVRQQREARWGPRDAHVRPFGG